ncbi:hypothetical protein FXO37_28365 [Capsicum annuum]|nr:hypothetical protein FXO37_28365 [Capsicum annuum]
MTSSDNLIEFPKPSVKLKVENLKMEIDKAINDKDNLNSGFELWNPGELPPSLIAFEGHVHQIDPSWHIIVLGDRSIINVSESILDDGAVIHFSGPAKP